jgi:hypothetical protein
METQDLRRAAVAGGTPGASAQSLLDRAAHAGVALETEIAVSGLAPLWFAATGLPVFQQAAIQASLLYAAQRALLAELAVWFDAADIPFVVFKGVALREWLYPADPSCRMSADIDLLVHPRDRLRAVRTLRDHGFALSITPANLSHEVTLSRGILDIDLHWDLLGPGRFRRWTAADVLATRQLAHGTWVPAPAVQAVLLLVHPAITKYLAWPAIALRLVDVLRWVEHPDLDWGALRPLLLDNGVTAAAWAMLEQARRHAPQPLADRCQAMADSLPVGRMQRAWLRAWLDSAILRHIREAALDEAPRGLHSVRRLGFSLFLTDSAADVVRSIASWRRFRQSQLPAELAAFSALE